MCMTTHLKANITLKSGRISLVIRFMKALKLHYTITLVIIIGKFGHPLASLLAAWTYNFGHCSENRIHEAY